MSSLNYANSYGSRSGSIKRNSYGYGEVPFVRTMTYAGYPRQISPVFESSSYVNRTQGNYNKNYGTGYEDSFGGNTMVHNAIGPLLGGNKYYSTDIQPFGRIRVDDSEPIERVNSNIQVAKYDNPCLEPNMKFVDCLRENNNDLTKCQNLYDDLKVCENNLKKRI